MKKYIALMVGIFILLGLSVRADVSLLVNHSANVYKEPTTKSEKLGRAKPGEIYLLKSTSQTNGYYQIDYSGQSAFVFRTLVKPTDAPATTADTAQSFSIVSWNVQTFGSLSEKRKEMFQQALPQVIGADVAVCSFQEVANEDGAKTLEELLGATTWDLSFKNSTDSQDNGVAYNINRATLLEDGFVFATVPDPNKPAQPDSALAKHPIRRAYMKVGDFDFTIFSVHLAWEQGNPASSAAELTHFLDWLRDDYFNDPANDPDVIITGDFNLPTTAGKPLSQRSGEPEWVPLEDVIQQHGTFAQGNNQLFVLINNPSSRDASGPKNNYDHFIISRDVKDEEFIKAELVDTELIDNIDGTSEELISDHYPIRAVFRSKGSGVALDSE